MTSSEIAVFEFIANLVLVAGLNNKLSYRNMDQPAKIAMYSGVSAGVIFDVLLLTYKANSQENSDTPMESYYASSDAVVAFFMVTVCTLAALAARHAVPAGINRAKDLIFTRRQSVSVINAPDLVDLEQDASINIGLNRGLLRNESFG